MRIDEARRIRHRFERLLQAVVAVSSRHALNEVLQELVEAACEVVHARYAALGVLSADGTHLVQFVTAGMDEETRSRIGDLPRGRGLLGHVIKHAKPIRTRDINKHPERFGFPPHHPPMKSFLGVPIAGRGGAVFGNLYLTEKIGAKEFSREDETIAVLLASQASVAIENARLFEESQALLGQVRAMQRQRDLFFAMMNHELRNALTGVYGWAERLIRTRSPETIPQSAREVYEAAERTITLLNNFLDLTRLDAGKVRPVWREITVAAALERATSGLEPAAESKDITLAIDIAGPPQLRTDPVRFEQIVVNLLSNAIRHSPNGRPVEIRADAAGTGVRVQVIDHGPGVPLELRERVFEPFERFDPHSGIGTGLGLPVSRRLAEVMGGKLWVEETPGGGATFVLVLPSAVDKQ